jgi:TPP-dependent pyruvate/acetoin dehydrogenase alpha subunit
LQLLEDRLRAAGLLDEASLTNIDREARRQVEEAVRFAAASQPPSPEELYRGVYAEGGSRWPR